MRTIGECLTVLLVIEESEAYEDVGVSENELVGSGVRVLVETWPPGCGGRATAAGGKRVSKGDGGPYWRTDLEGW